MDPAKFRQFYQANFDRIYRFVRLRVGDSDLAEDLVSEIFLKALKAFETYDESRSRSSWIYTIARNHLINHYRTAGRVVAEEDIESWPIPADDFGEIAARRQEVGILLRAIGELPPEKRQLIKMKYLEELSYGEMAERLGKERGALKVATFRAMRELRAALQGKI